MKNPLLFKLIQCDLFATIQAELINMQTGGLKNGKSI